MQQGRLALATIAFMSFAAAAVAQTSPYFLVYPAVAVLPQPGEDGRYSAITWLPAQTLLFELSNQTPLRDYTLATTQDGARVLLWNPASQRNISAGPLLGGDAFPDMNADLIVFHTQYLLCRNIGCEDNPDNPEAKLIAQPGYVGRIAEKRPDIDYVRIEIDLIQKESGWISTTRLGQLIDTAAVTRVNLQDNSFVHPHFSVERQVSGYLTTSCGEVWGAGRDLTFVDGEIAEFEFDIMSQMDIAEVNRAEHRLVDLSQFGGDNERWEHRVYQFTSRVGDPTRIYYASIKYNCSPVGAGGRPISVISEVEIVGPSGERILLEPNGTPPGLRTLAVNAISDAYLWSVNTQEQYFGLMSALFTEFNNRAIAGYFLTEFSRACPGAIRTTLQCTSHQY